MAMSETTIEDIFGLNNKDSDCPDNYLTMLAAFGQEKEKKMVFIFAV